MNRRSSKTADVCITEGLIQSPPSVSAIWKTDLKRGSSKKLHVLKNTVSLLSVFPFIATNRVLSLNIHVPGVQIEFSGFQKPRSSCSLLSDNFFFLLNLSLFRKTAFHLLSKMVIVISSHLWFVYR